MNTWFTADTHFGHKNIIKYCPITRGHFKTTYDMNQQLITNWNNTVGKLDEVYFLGDFAFADQAEIKRTLEKLHGRIHFIAGNHDKAFNATFVDTLLRDLTLESFHKVYLERNFVGNYFVLNHYAQRTWNRAFHGAIHLFGHSHGTLDAYGKSVDVGVDSLDMAEFTGDTLRPWALSEILDFMATRESVYE